MKQNKYTGSVLIIITFLFAFYGQRFLGRYFPIEFTTYIGKALYTYAWWLVPSSIVIGLLYGFKNLHKEFGLYKGLFTGLAFAAITVAPMLISSAITGELNRDMNPGELIHKTVLAGLMEELFFRAFLFGILFRKLGWGFIPASILGAVIFGIGHLYQASSFAEAGGIFLVTAMGAVWFSWLFIEWNKNLWVPVFLHILMNMSWILFDVSNNALGGFSTNLFRITTIALTIIITIIYKRKKGSLAINRKCLIINSEA